MKTAREVVRDDFKPFCDKHADTCLCGNVLSAIEARDAEHAQALADAVEKARGEALDQALEKVRMTIERGYDFIDCMKAIAALKGARP